MQEVSRHEFWKLALCHTQLEESAPEVGAGCPSFENQFKMDPEERPQKEVQSWPASPEHPAQTETTDHGAGHGVNS